MFHDEIYRKAERNIVYEDENIYGSIRIWKMQNT